MTGWWQTEQWVCLPCTEVAGTDADGKPKEQVFTRSFPDSAVTDIDDLTPLEIGENTVPPTTD